MPESDSFKHDSDKVIKAITPGAKTAHSPLNDSSRTQKKIVLNRSSGIISQRITLDREEAERNQHTLASDPSVQKQPPSFGKILVLSIAGVLLLGGGVFALTQLSGDPKAPPPSVVENTPAIPSVTEPIPATPPPVNTSPLARGLIAHWKLDGSLEETTGSEMTGVTRSPATYVEGKDGKAIRFDGTDPIKIDEVSPAIKSLDQIFTISTWVRAKSGVTQSLWAAFVSRGAGLYSLCLRQNHPGRFHMTLSKYDDPHRTGLSTKGKEYPAGAWHHLCFVRDGSSASLYVNGEVAASHSTVKPSLNTQSDAALMIGGNPSNKLISEDNRAFIGDIDDVRIYDRALSPEHVIRLYKR